MLHSPANRLEVFKPARSGAREGRSNASDFIVITGARRTFAAALCGYALVLWPAAVLAEKQSCNDGLSAQLRLDSGHPWRPPFGVDRVGAPLVVHAEVKALGAPLREYRVVAYRDGRVLERQPLTVGLNPAVRSEAAPISVAPLFGNSLLTSNPTEVALAARCAGHGTFQEVTRQSVTRPELEAEAVARADLVINPVDLGTILMPHDWLLLTSGQKAVIDFAAISRTRDLPNARLRARFAGGKFSETAIPLARHRRAIAFGLRCKEAGVRPSMGSVGDAYDNAMCESFFATLECRITAHAVIPESGAEGVIVSYGGRESGFALYAKGNRLTYENRRPHDGHELIEADTPLPPGDVVLAFEFTRESTSAGVGWFSKTSFGIGRLSMNGKTVGQAKLTQILGAGYDETFGIGQAFGPPVSTMFRPPFKFTGILDKVTVQLQ